MRRQTLKVLVSERINRLDKYLPYVAAWRHCKNGLLPDGANMLVGRLRLMHVVSENIRLNQPNLSLSALRQNLSVTIAPLQPIGRLRHTHWTHTRAPGSVRYSLG